MVLLPILPFFRQRFPSSLVLTSFYQCNDSLFVQSLFLACFRLLGFWFSFLLDRYRHRPQGQDLCCFFGLSMIPSF